MKDDVRVAGSVFLRLTAPEVPTDSAEVEYDAGVLDVAGRIREAGADGGGWPVAGLSAESTMR